MGKINQVVIFPYGEALGGRKLVGYLMTKAREEGQKNTSEETAQRGPEGFNRRVMG